MNHTQHTHTPPHTPQSAPKGASGLGAARERGVRFNLVVEVGNDHPGAKAVPIENRLKQWLKIGLRAFGFKVIEISEPTAEAAQNQTQEGNGR